VHRRVTKMSSISSVVGSARGQSHHSKTGNLGGPAKRIEKELTSFLDEKGLSAEKHSSIHSDLQDSIQAALGSGGPPSPAKIQDAVQDVLDKHGLDSREFLSKMQLAFRSGSENKVGQTSVSTSSGVDSLETLLEFLAERAEDKVVNDGGELNSEKGNDSGSESNDSDPSNETRLLSASSVFDVEA
jgi:hypothetical protein